MSVKRSAARVLDMSLKRSGARPDRHIGSLERGEGGMREGQSLIALAGPELA
ncbi:hypothetical protein [Dactylosporangium sp. NPDC051541]|uniref:hypothetical protein n=1 Tax=Dactylosporangium sp. NPDC051541 TaxID=3363977 RepID=UPI0037B4D775